MNAVAGASSSLSRSKGDRITPPTRKGFLIDFSRRIFVLIDFSNSLSLRWLSVPQKAYPDRLYSFTILTNKKQY